MGGGGGGGDEKRKYKGNFKITTYTLAVNPQSKYKGKCKDQNCNHHFSTTLSERTEEGALCDKIKTDP